MVAMENFKKCTVAMLGGPCMQHVTGNTSWLNQPQSATDALVLVLCWTSFKPKILQLQWITGENKWYFEENDPDI